MPHIHVRLAFEPQHQSEISWYKLSRLGAKMTSMRRFLALSLASTGWYSLRPEAEHRWVHLRVFKQNADQVLWHEARSVPSCCAGWRCFEPDRCPCALRPRFQGPIVLQ